MTLEGYELFERTPSVEEYNRIRVSAGLSEKDKAAAEVGLRNSLFSVCVERLGELVAIGRVIGDGGVYFDVVDLAVDPAHQGKGIGRLMMDRLMAYVRSKARNNSFISLFSNVGLAPFYEQYGFKVRDPESPGMSQRVTLE